jgi:hypothetical protein
MKPRIWAVSAFACGLLLSYIVMTLAVYGGFWAGMDLIWFSDAAQLWSVAIIVTGVLIGGSAAFLVRGSSSRQSGIALLGVIIGGMLCYPITAVLSGLIPIEYILSHPYAVGHDGKGIVILAPATTFGAIIVGYAARRFGRRFWPDTQT